MGRIAWHPDTTPPPLTRYLKRKIARLEVIDGAACETGAIGIVRSGSDPNRGYAVRIGTTEASCECDAFTGCSHIYKLALEFADKRRPGGCHGTETCAICQRSLKPPLSFEALLERMGRS